MLCLADVTDAWKWVSSIDCVQDDLVDEVADVDTVPNEKKQHEVTAAISNSFGFGGHNSVVVFAPYKE